MTETSSIGGPKPDAEILPEKRISVVEEGQTAADEIDYWRNLAETRPPDWMPIVTLVAGFAAGFAFAAFITTADQEKRAGRVVQEIRQPMPEYGPGPH